MLTESQNPSTRNIDQLSSLEMVQRINDEDAKVAGAVRQALPQIAQAVDAIAERIRRGGRLIYVGAGTSGRLGVLDASECVPTFSVDPVLDTTMVFMTQLLPSDTHPIRSQLRTLLHAAIIGA